MALAKRALGQAPAGPTSQTPKEDLVNVATLVRGRVYFYKEMKFEYGVPLVVTAEVADILENEVATVNDKDGERFEKPFFHIQRGVQKPDRFISEAERNRKIVRRLAPATVRRRG